MTLPFYILDVFAENKYEGNQLAVFRNAATLTTAQMQAIAREINFAESTFILSDTPEGGGYNVRIFTPDTELPFAGHPTLGTSWLILDQIAAGNSLMLNLKVGQISVIKLPDGAMWLTAAQPKFREMTFSSQAIADFAQLSHAQITEFGHVSTGVPCLVIWLNAIDALQNIAFDVAKVKAFFMEHQLHQANSPAGISSQMYWVVPTSDGVYRARMFCWEHDRLVEDPATGSAASCFLAYLLKNKKPQVEATIYQGVEIGRNARIYLKGHRTGDHYQIGVGGNVVKIAEGSWKV